MVNRKLPVNLLHRRQIADGLRTKKWLARRTACGERHDEKRQQSQPYEALIHSRTNEQWRWRCSSRGHRRRDCGGAILASGENYETRLRPAATVLKTKHKCSIVEAASRRTQNTTTHNS